LNKEALGLYCRDFARVIGNDFFSSRDFITGQQILSICKVRQINLFIIYKLLNNWKIEIDKLKSPYFDYGANEVKKSLQEFKNALSRHIKLHKTDFMPILENAVYGAILIVISPYDYYCDIISQHDSEVHLNRLKELSKYIKINNSILIAFIDRLEKENQLQLSSKDALVILNEVFENINHSPEDIDGYVEVFSRTKLLKIDRLFENEDGEKRLLDKTLKGEGSAPDRKMETVETLNDQLSAESENRPSLANIHQSKKIESIKYHLSINQKFMFINQLFAGKVEDFNKVVDFLDNCPSQAEAINFINNNYLKKNIWKKDSTEVKEFIEVVAKKYA